MTALDQDLLKGAPTDRQRPRRSSRAVLAGWRLALSAALGLAASPVIAADDLVKVAPATVQVEAVTVTASTVDQLGIAATSSQGAITRQELDLRPVYRVGQLLETIPGLTVTAHSGEGKANQYLLRGFNLDHGTDLATFIDGMPVNMRTHTHGQGYTDLSFLIPELAGGVTFTKGPYFAAEGDFGSVGADHIHLLDAMPTQIAVSAGTLDDQRVFAGGSTTLSNGATLLAAGEWAHLDGPWDHPDDYRKTNLAVRWRQGNDGEGNWVTGLYSRGRWNATTDQPRRAVTKGLIGRFGTLDPSDGGQSERFSLSGGLARSTSRWALKANAYVVRQQLTLWNNFTHLLEDPLRGDQHGQNDRRTFAGGAASATYATSWGVLDTVTIVGAQVRYDQIYVDLRKTQTRLDLATLRADRVREVSASVYVENTTRWNSWVRTVLGARQDYFHVVDHSLVGGLSGVEGQSLFQPKASLVLGPWREAELYVSAGRGFHSNDGRAGLIEGDDGSATYRRPPLLVRSSGLEVGVRASPVRGLHAALTLFQTDFDSELVYNADAGQTEAGRPSRRRGLEASVQYRPLAWLELNSNIAISRARYRDADPTGSHIEDAPGFVGSIGALVDNLGPWFGAIQWRDLGSHPLVEDNSVRSPGYREVNLNVGYKFNPRTKVRLDVFNVTGSRSNAADYYYEDRISASDPSSGVADIHSHPLEPRSARISIISLF